MKRMITASLMFLLLLSATACGKAPSKEATPLNAENKAGIEITAQAPVHQPRKEPYIPSFCQPCKDTVSPSRRAALL